MRERRLGALGWKSSGALTRLLLCLAALALLIAGRPGSAGAQGPEGQPTAQNLADARVLSDQAARHAEQGRYADAERLYRHALAIAEQAAEPGHPSVAALLNNYGALLAEMGRYAEAEISPTFMPGKENSGRRTPADFGRWRWMKRTSGPGIPAWRPPGPFSPRYASSKGRSPRRSCSTVKHCRRGKRLTIPSGPAPRPPWRI
jgi:hypothetical protein